jgi:hypothetical protein
VPELLGIVSEIPWIRRLGQSIKIEGNGESTKSDSLLLKSQPEAKSTTGFANLHMELENNICLGMMNYPDHIGDFTTVPVGNQSNLFLIPLREHADEYFNAYMTLVHPSFSFVHQKLFTSQYISMFQRHVMPPQKWLAVLNMVFAIGCKYCRLLNTSGNPAYHDDRIFLSRAQQLGLGENSLFSRPELQQAQLESMVAFYLLCSGQINEYACFVLTQLIRILSTKFKILEHRNSPIWRSTPQFHSASTPLLHTDLLIMRKKTPVVDYGGLSIH